MPQPYRYPSDVSDDEWAFCVGYLALVREDAPQRKHDLRAVFDALRYVTRTGAPWRYLPGHFPPWQAVQQQAERWTRAGVFEAMAHDLRAIVRWLDGRHADPSAVILDGRTLQSRPTSGSRAGYDGAKRRKGSKVHAAVDTLGNLLAVAVTPANEQERAQVGVLCERIQQVCGERVEIALVDPGYTGDTAREAGAGTRSGWRWSSIPRRSEGSCCCRVGGWWSGRSGGWHGSGGWLGTTSGCQRRWRACTLWPLWRCCCVSWPVWAF